MYTDSTVFSFSVMTASRTDTTLTTLIRTMGKVKDYPRPVKIVVDAEKTTAIAGTHYEVDLSNVVIPAGKSEVAFPVKFIRSADMVNNKVDLVFRLEDNDYFKVPFAEQKNHPNYNSDGAIIMADRYRFTVSEIYAQPWSWMLAEEFFGQWTVAKYKFINEELDLTISDWENAGMSDKLSYGRLQVQVYYVRNALQALADAGTPVMDDDGEYMQLTDMYRVDYSAYL
jgi:hypothetical protein